jgi:hypothetical protein
MTEPIAKLAKPKFAELLAHYKTLPSSVHNCRLIDPTKDAINTCAARMSEAVVLALKLAASRAEIGNLGNGKGDGTTFLLGKFGYGRFGKLCPHGIGRGPQDLAAFLVHHWGARTRGWQARPAAPDDAQGKKGIIAFLKIPGYRGQGHIDLWNGDHAVGDDYWNAATIWMWDIG